MAGSSTLLKTKSIEQLVADVEHGKHLKRSLTAWDLTLLGIGAVIGTGIFVLTGTAAANQAGPGIMLSYLIAGLACGFAALCYAEFASMIPIAGSAYTYAYATLGEIFAWLIGWDLILEYAVGSMTVSIGWSGYVQKLLAGVGIHLPVWMSAAPGSVPGALINLPASFSVLAITGLLVVGVRESARANAVMVAIKLVAIAFFIGAGAFFVKPANWSPFMPFGWSGVMAAGAVVFFAYIGFDAISTTAEEARNPQRDLPIGIIASLTVCTLLYLAVSAVLTGIVPVTQMRDDVHFLNAPVAFALSMIQQDWAAYLVSAGAVAGITSVLLVMLMSQPRIFFAMSRDRLLPPAVSAVHPRFGTPYVTTLITGVIVASIAGFTQIQVVGEMTSIGTLFAFMVVCAAVIVLRIKRPDARRPFRVPFGAVFPTLGIVACLYLMLSLPVMTWARFIVWLDIGIAIYWFYGRTHSLLAEAQAKVGPSPLSGVAPFVMMLGVLIFTNGVLVATLGLMTRIGVTTADTAKWHELHMSPEIALHWGGLVLALGAVVFVAGMLLRRASASAQTA